MNFKGISKYFKIFKIKNVLRIFGGFYEDTGGVTMV